MVRRYEQLEEEGDRMIGELLGVALLIFLAKMLEEVMVRKGIPPLIGWSLAGIILGPAILGLIHPTTSLVLLSSVGIYLFFFIIGLEEIDVKSLALSLNTRYLVSMLMATSIIMLTTYAIGLWLGLSSIESISLAVLASLPTASVVAKTLSDMGLLRTSVGALTFSYALLGETIGLILAGTLLELGTVEQLEVRRVALQLGEVALFFIIAIVLGILIAPRFIEAVGLYMVSRGAQVGAIFGLLLLFVAIGEAFGVHGAIGALILGLVLSDVLQEESSRASLETLKGIGDGVFIPLFFAAIGLKYDWVFITHDALLLVVIPLILTPYRAMIHYLTLRALRAHYCKEVASSMLARGAVDLAVLATLMEAGLVSSAVYSLIIATSILSLLCYPLAANRLLKISHRKAYEGPPLMPFVAKYVLSLIRVCDVMEEPALIPVNMAKEEAMKALEDKKLDYGIVVDEEGKLLGIVHRSRLSSSETVKEIVRKPKLVAKPEEKLHVILHEMIILGQRVVPVVDEADRAIGVITLKGVLKFLFR